MSGFGVSDVILTGCSSLISCRTNNSIQLRLLNVAASIGSFNDVFPAVFACPLVNHKRFIGITPTGLCIFPYLTFRTVSNKFSWPPKWFPAIISGIEGVYTLFYWVPTYEATTSSCNSSRRTTSPVTLIAYLAKLYFAETYRGVTGPGQRVFSMNVEGQKFENFDIWKKAGGFMRAYIESVPVNVSDGEFKIDFIAKTQSPAINAIEIIPQTTDGATDDGKSSPIRIKAGQGDAFKDSRGREWSPAQGFEGGSFGGLRASANFSRRGGFGGGRRGRGPRSGAAYSSIIAYEFEGKRQYAQLVAEALIGVDPSDGKFLWRYDRASNRSRINCSTPVYHNGMVFAASAYSNGGGLVRLEKSGNGATTAEEVWFSKDMQNHHGGVLIIDGAVYGSNGGNGGGYLICLDFDTGEVLWNEADRDKRRVKKGSVAYADNRIYYRTEDGEMILIEPNPKEYIERGRFMQPDRTSKPAWAHPVVANGKLYIRDQETLYCYDIKAQGR